MILTSPIRLGSGLVVERTPETDFELWVVTQALWGLKIPRVKVCANHDAPFKTFADNFFGREPVIVLKGSRGLSGKSYMGAGLGLTNAALWGCKVNVLGGSASQSVNVHEHMTTSWDYWNAPKHLLVEDPSKFETKLTNGGKIRALMASSRSVRGPHPARLLLDEIDEMELRILDDAMGMPMHQTLANGVVVKASTLMMSTHQYPDRTMTAMIRRAREKNWPLRESCYRESANPIDGWLSIDLIHQKRREISNEMWRIEYELGEPAIEGRAVATEHVIRMYDRNRDWPELGKYAAFEGANGKEYIFEQPIPGVMYATGVDWARTKDWTVIDTWRTDTWERVAWMRVQKRTWPEMIGMAIRRFQKYPGHLAHDSTGLGDVIAGVFPEYMRSQNQIHDIVMVGNTRATLFSEFVTAAEQDTFASPYIEPAHDELLYTTHDDLYRAGTKFHPPDSVVAHALAWHLRGEKRIYVAPVVDGLDKPGAEGWLVQQDNWSFTTNSDDAYRIDL